MYTAENGPFKFVPSEVRTLTPLAQSERQRGVRRSTRCLSYDVAHTGQSGIVVQFASCRAPSKIWIRGEMEFGSVHSRRCGIALRDVREEVLLLWDGILRERLNSWMVETFKKLYH